MSNEERGLTISEATRGLIGGGNTSIVSSAALAIAMASEEEFDARLALLERYRKRVERIFLTIMKPEIDYGVIPGTGDKPTLLQPGAETLLNAFGYVATFPPEYTVREVGDGVSSPQIRYQVTCVIRAGDEVGPVVGWGGGTSNSWEKRNRYRDRERTCPHCHKPAIVKGKEEYGGGWVCFRKKGGCGANFADDDPAIMSQQVGQMENPDPYDLDNTLYKIAAKRGMIDAAKRSTGTSHLFTQDMDELADILAASNPAEAAAAGERRREGTRQSGKQPANGTAKPTTNGTRNPDALPEDITAIPAWFRAKVEAMKPLPWAQETTAKNAQSLAVGLKNRGFSDDDRHTLYRLLTGKSSGSELEARELVVLLENMNQAPRLLELVRQSTHGPSGKSDASPSGDGGGGSAPSPTPQAMPTEIAQTISEAVRQYVTAEPSLFTTDAKKRATALKACQDRLTLFKMDARTQIAVFSLLHLAETGETVGAPEIGRRLNGHWLAALQTCPDSFIEVLGAGVDWMLANKADWPGKGA